MVQGKGTPLASLCFCRMPVKCRRKGCGGWWQGGFACIMPGSTHPGRVVRRSWQDGKSGPGRRQISQKPGSNPIKDIAMPKIKTNRAAAKRFRKTASGKYKCGHANRSHILTKKATKRKRNLRQTGHVRAEDAGRIDPMLP